jgi:hypothetical protein
MSSWGIHQATPAADATPRKLPWTEFGCKSERISFCICTFQLNRAPESWTLGYLVFFKAKNPLKLRSNQPRDAKSAEPQDSEKWMPAM